MYRISALSVLTVFGLAPVAPAQVVIRAPFVRVQVGGGVAVRAPFVNVNVGPGVAVRAPFVNLYVPGRPPIYCPPPPVLVPAPAAPGPESLPAPTREPEKAGPPPPQPTTTATPLTLDAFARSFQPREGSYEVVLENPVTGAPATVRFSLPAGTPRNVTVSRRALAFAYDGGQRVRIAFDRKGARVTSQ